jgi:hypothetical protein
VIEDNQQLGGEYPIPLSAIFLRCTAAEEPSRNEAGVDQHETGIGKWVRKVKTAADGPIKTTEDADPDEQIGTVDSVR